MSPRVWTPLVDAEQRDLRDRVAQDAGGDRVALGVVRVQEAVRRRPLDHLGELPAQVDGILHADVEALAAHRVVHVGGVAGQQDPPVAVGRGLPGHVGEPRDRPRAVHPVVGPPHARSPALRSPSVASLAGPRLLLGHHDPHRPVVQPAEAMDAGGVLAHAPLAAPRPARPRRSGSSSSAPTPGNSMPAALRTTLRPPSQPTRYSARSDRRRTARRRRRRRPGRTRSRRARDGTAPRARRPTPPVTARCVSATARARTGAAWESR